MQKNCLGYPVEFVEDVFGESAVLSDILRQATGSERPRVLIVADMNVVQRTEGLGSRIGKYVNEHGIELAGSPVVIAGGEKVKADNLQSVFRVLSAILDAKLGRNDCVLAIGGGTLLDVAGYAAAQARGGVRIVRLPTTPAAMMCAAFADYAAVDSQGVKDALRIPCVPSAVIIDLAFARTVLDGVWRGGLGEAVRIAAVSDATLTRKLVKLAPAYRERDEQALEVAVRGAVSVLQKKGPVRFAEWVAARLESMSGYKLPHGYAIAIGVCIDAAYAVEKGYLKEKDQELICGILGACGALDGLAHSRHILGQADNVLLGLDAWRLSFGDESIELPGGVGKAHVDSAPDREAFRKVLSEFVAVATES